MTRVRRDAADWRSTRKLPATVASEKDDQMSETMIKNRNLPNPHLFEPFFCTRVCHHPSSQLIYRRRLFLKLFEAYIISYFS